MKNKLALFGGEKTRREPFPHHPMIGKEEKRAAQEVLDSGNLSSFIAAPGKNFLGGKKILEFEKIFREYHDIKYAVSFNSATAALHAAVVACGVKPLDEVITTPYTFTSTATCILMNNSFPVFADILENTYSISPSEIQKNITEYTKAIIPVHIFGNPAHMNRIMKIAQENDLKVIEDCAQAPGARYRDKLVGTIGDCGIFSFTENKNITSGEGGMLITNNKEIAEISRLVRNHGEAVIAGQNRTYKTSILGWNYRMTEVDAAIGIEQFKKLDYFTETRIHLAEYLKKNLINVKGLTPQIRYLGNKHVYYVFAMKYDEEIIGIPRDKFVEALNAEGIPFGAGYIKPLYYSPIYHENKPFFYKYANRIFDYGEGLCPVAEKSHFKDVIMTLLARPPATERDMDDIVRAIKKIIENRDEFQN